MNVHDVDISKYITQQYIDNFLSCTFPNAAPITKKIGLPKIGSHLITSRIAYTHHGIYVANERVVHYSGFSDGLRTGPVEEVSLNQFHRGNGFSVKPHPEAIFSGQEISDRAKHRLHEKSYSLLYNNCEHFVTCCIYNVNASSQVGAVSKVATHTALRALGRSNVYTSFIAALAHSGLYISSYIQGDISKEKLFTEISHSAVVTTSSFYYAALGQAAIPIPVVGALVGASVGYFVGNILHKSGLIALGDSELVKEAKERRRDIESLCEFLIPEIRKSRKVLEEYIGRYFSDRKEEFLQSFLLLDNSLNGQNPDDFAYALEKINNQFSASLQFKKFGEFDQFMKTKEAFDF